MISFPDVENLLVYASPNFKNATNAPNFSTFQLGPIVRDSGSMLFELCLKPQNWLSVRCLVETRKQYAQTRALFDDTLHQIGRNQGTDEIEIKVSKTKFGVWNPNVHWGCRNLKAIIETRWQNRKKRSRRWNSEFETQTFSSNSFVHWGPS